MFSSKIPGFYKSEDCPYSTELLEFQRDELSKVRSHEITVHLAGCEFCSAEVEFYSCFPQDDSSIEANEVVGIPAPLFQLAEALLKNRHADSTSLDSLLQEKGGVVVDQV